MLGWIPMGKQAFGDGPPRDGPRAFILVRHAQFQIVETVDKFGWTKGKVLLGDMALQGLQLLATHLHEWNGYPIRTLHTAIPLAAILGADNQFMVGRAVPNHCLQDET